MSRDAEIPPLPADAMYATAAQLTVRYQVSLRYIERRPVEFGATPISDAANSKLRYHLATADAFMESRRLIGAAVDRPRRAGGARPSTSTPAGAPLVSF